MKPTKEIEELMKGCDGNCKRQLNFYTKEVVILCPTCKTKLQTLQKAYKEFAKVLEEEMYFLECIKGWRDWGKMSVFVKKNILNKISHLTQLKKEYEEAGK